MRQREMLSLAASISFAAIGLAQAGEVVRAVSCEAPPYVSAAMPDQGVLVKLTREMLAPMGYDVRISYKPCARIYVEADQYDLVLAVVPEEVKKGQLESFTPLFLSRVGFFTRKDVHIDVGSKAELKHRIIGITRGYGYPAKFFQSNFKLDPANDDETNFLKLAAKRFDLFITDQTIGEYLLMTKLPNLRGKVTWNEPAYAEVPLGLAIVPASRLREKLRVDLSAGLKAVKAKGIYQQTFKQGNDIKMFEFPRKPD